MNDIRLQGCYSGGRCWEVLTRQRMSDEKALENYGYKVYSQNDEDGIINEIFKRIGTTNKEFIEFGVQNGLESNCHFLLHKDWRGLWIEGSKTYYNEIQIRFKPVIKEKLLRVVNEFITKENINEVLEKNAFSENPDLMSIDIDGNDWHIWNCIEFCSPRVVCIEYNGKFPPDVEWVQAYNPSHMWDKSDWQGASLLSMQKLGEKKGYRLVGTNLNGVNAFFVKKELINDRFLDMYSADELFNPFRDNLEFRSGHHSEFCLAKQGEFVCREEYFESHKDYKKYNSNSFLQRIKNLVWASIKT